jgi:DNA-binding NarL/FixJ family response regulator
MIVDDSEILRFGLTIFCEVYDDFEMVGAAGNGQQAIELCGLLHPDVVLMDVHMPVMDGLTATRIMVRQHPDIPVLILTASPGVTTEQGIQAGARAVMTKNVPNDTLADTIRAAVE